jgi:hypothetical protein
MNPQIKHQFPGLLKSYSQIVKNPVHGIKNQVTIVIERISEVIY